ncbi:DUF342 domain-containing protein [Aliidiomarina maris]|uniref:Flagellar Assembly Protein A N-terminal region domain-containing protein n=1 Tax=Aliidiomarina maris TaxID=531312 RepID=A0A327X527_9GAMM|nr:FapA family protein [Aliidiomarina maris]RAK00635.1 hypothetical protein B0I24_10260 [Aliidiomarina maris]RUO27354.1 hypothetical protein CWE07_05275 [Aliidiomarina maris]
MQGIDFVQTDQTLFLKVDPSLAIAELDVNALAQAFAESDMRQCLLDDNAFDTALKAMVKKGSAMVRIGQCLPAQFELIISDDDMQVSARVHAPYGGNPLTLNKILKLLREAGITMGIRRQGMEKLVLHTQTADPGSEIEVVLARGRAAIDGDDTRFEALAQDARDRVLRPQQADGDRVDMRNLGEIISIEAGTPILKRIPPTPGSAGFTVKGQTLAPVPGLNRELKVGQGTELSPDDNNILLAARQGLPRIMDNTAHVDDVLTMRKVDATTGHVNYEGSIVISGNVGPGMRVIAGGDITVNGYVDSAFLQAEGNITITKGVIGQQAEVNESDESDAQIEHSTQIIAAGSIWVSYSQYATLRAAKGLIVDKQLTHCHVITSGTLCLGGEGKEAKGKLIGGTVDTNTHVYAGQLGAPAGTRTRINIQDPAASPAYLQAKDALTTELKTEIATVNKLTKVRHKAKRQMSGPTLERFLSTLDPKLENHRRNITVLKIRAHELQKEAPERQMIVVHANRVLHSGVVFHSTYESKRIEENRGPSTLILKHGSFSYQYVG